MCFHNVKIVKIRDRNTLQVTLMTESEFIFIFFKFYIYFFDLIFILSIVPN